MGMPVRMRESVYHQRTKFTEWTYEKLWLLSFGYSSANGDNARVAQHEVVQYLGRDVSSSDVPF